VTQKEKPSQDAGVPFRTHFAARMAYPHGKIVHIFSLIFLVVWGFLLYVLI
jgi:hypothetical protein